MPPRFDLEKCSGCGLCDAICPADAIRLDPGQNKAMLEYPDECWHCGACRQDCPEEAIDIRFPPEMLAI